VLGIAALEERPGMRVDLVESNARKCAFLRHIARLTGAAVTVHQARLQDILGQLGGTDVVTARALASLTDLIAWSEQLLKTGAIGLFPKGRDAAVELTEAGKSWRFEADVVPSRTDSDARIIRIRSLHGQSSQ
jgi:16S rRNA (guanine527-N7)-methyltransferase